LGGEETFRKTNGERIGKTAGWQRQNLQPERKSFFSEKSFRII